jgi:signal transduction histidine kinase
VNALRGRVARIDGRRIDSVVAAAVIVALELELRSFVRVGGVSGVVTGVAAVLFAAPVSVRRSWPAGALISSSAAAAVQAALGGHLSEANGIIVPVVLLAYGAGAWLPSRRGLSALVVAAALFSGLALTTPTPGSIGEAGQDTFFVALFFFPPWFAGRITREPSRRAAAFRALAEQAAAENDERERVAVAEERARIGNELQDIIAHSVSAMIIQAGGARGLMFREPDRARTSILQVEQTGREALADLRRLLGLLRKDDDPRALAPQPGLKQLAALVDSLRLEGLDCELRREDEVVDLTPGVDLVGFRVVEAALLTAAANGAQHASVRIRVSEELLEIEVRGDRTIPALEHELTGISQRVLLYDGRLRVLPADGAGFAMLATLPLALAVVA